MQLTSNLPKIKLKMLIFVLAFHYFVIKAHFKRCMSLKYLSYITLLKCHYLEMDQSRLLQSIHFFMEKG